MRSPFNPSAFILYPFPMKLIFLHYFGGGPRSWDGVISLLPQHDCVALDLREAGLLPTGYSVGEAAGDVQEQLGDIAEPWVLVGHSMGGKIALEIASRQPANLRGCVLIAPSPPTPEPMTDADRQSMLEGHGTREAAQRIVAGAAAAELPSETWETAIAANLAYCDRDWENWIKLGTREDISAQMPHIIVPMLVIAGEFDKGMSPDFLRAQIIATIPRTHLETVSGTGHLVPQVKPDETAKLIRDWVESLPAPALI